jgi:hypothetical protein
MPSRAQRSASSSRRPRRHSPSKAARRRREFRLRERAGTLPRLLRVRCPFCDATVRAVAATARSGRPLTVCERCRGPLPAVPLPPARAEAAEAWRSARRLDREQRR